MAKCRLGKNIATISFQQRSIQQTSEGAASSSHTMKLAVVPAISEQSTTAELLWMLKVAKNDFSIASYKGPSDFFQKMFPGPVTEGFEGIILNIRWFRANTDKAPNERNQQY